MPKTLGRSSGRKVLNVFEGLDYMPETDNRLPITAVPRSATVTKLRPQVRIRSSFVRVGGVY